MINLVREKNPMPEQSPEVRVGNFEEVSQGYTKDMAIREAMRCLKCRKKPCMMKGCPTQMRIPEFIAKVAEGDFEAASQEIARLCQAAFRETVSEYHADVFDVEPCLWSQCYKDMEQSDWKTAAGQMHFSVQVNPHKNML